jgi:hypothetical protein
MIIGAPSPQKGEGNLKKLFIGKKALGASRGLFYILRLAIIISNEYFFKLLSASARAH